LLVLLLLLLELRFGGVPRQHEPVRRGSDLDAID
jgi:hypothetical protein